MKNTITLLACWFYCFLGFGQTQLNQSDGDPLIIHSSFENEHFDLLTNNRGDVISIPAGDAIEGDYISGITFSNDGDRVFVAHRRTNNISVFDWTSQTIIHNIEVGMQPVDIGVTDSLLIVACMGSDEVWLVNLEDYSTKAIIPTSAEPVKIRISFDQSLAVVGCDELDLAEVIDLTIAEKIKTIPNFDVFLYKFSFISSNPRNSVYWSGFEIAPDNSYLVNGAAGPLRFYDLESGQIVHQIDEIQNAAQVAWSGDSSKLITVTAVSPGVVSQVDAVSKALLHQVKMQGVSVLSFYSSVATNYDGSKALVPSFPENTALVRFDTEDYTHIPLGAAPDWVASSPNYEYAIAGDYFLSIIDYEAEALVGQFTGISIQNGNVSPTNNRIVASDPLRFEGIHFYNFENPGSVQFENASPTGSILEADVAYSANITPDGSKVVVMNSLSGTASVIDVATESLVAIIPLGSPETYHIDFTSDSKYGLVAKRLENKVVVIDLETNTVVANVSSGGIKPDQVFVLPGDDKAYVLNAGGADAIGRIALNGANTNFLNAFASGNTGISWTNYGIRSDFKITDDGNLGVLAAPFDNKVQVYDLNSDELLGEVEVEGFPLQIALTHDTEFGVFAGLTLKNDNAIALMTPSSSGIDLLNVYPCGNNPTRIAWNIVTQQFGICIENDQSIEYFGLNALDFVETENFAPNYTPIALLFDQYGSAFKLLRSEDTDLVPHQLRIGNFETYDIPEAPIHNFDITSDGKVVAIALPASDDLFLIKRDATGVRKVNINLNIENMYSISPNPATSKVKFQIKSSTALPNTTVSIKLFNTSGQVVFKRSVCCSHQFELDNLDLPSGTYLYQVQDHKQLTGAGKLVVQMSE